MNLPSISAYITTNKTAICTTLAPTDTPTYIPTLFAAL